MRKKHKRIVVVPPEPILLTTEELSAFLNISDRTIQKWEKEGLPIAIRKDNILRFDRQACLSWLAEQK